jgi:hypothetical protein
MLNQERETVVSSNSKDVSYVNASQQICSYAVRPSPSELSSFPPRLFVFIIIIIYFNFKLGFIPWQWYYNKTQHTNNTSHKITQHTKLHTHNNKLRRMKIQQSQLQLYKVVLLIKISML